MPGPAAESMYAARRAFEQGPIQGPAASTTARARISNLAPVRRSSDLGSGHGLARSEQSLYFNVVGDRPPPGRRRTVRSSASAAPAGEIRASYHRAAARHRRSRPEAGSSRAASAGRQPAGRDPMIGDPGPRFRPEDPRSFKRERDTKRQPALGTGAPWSGRAPGAALPAPVRSAAASIVPGSTPASAGDRPAPGSAARHGRCGDCSPRWPRRSRPARPARPCSPRSDGVPRDAGSVDPASDDEEVVDRARLSLFRSRCIDPDRRVAAFRPARAPDMPAGAAL